MKEASILLKLDKHLQVLKHNVTPIEALVLVAEHHKNAGENPVDVLPGTEKDVTRTEDEELKRLRTRYDNKKIKAMLTEVRNLPATFKEAVSKGIEMVLPGSPTFAESGAPGDKGTITATVPVATPPAK